MPSFNGPKVAYISSLNEVNYPGPCKVLMDGQQPTAEDIKSFPGKIFVLRSAPTEQDYVDYANKLDEHLAQRDPMMALVLKQMKAREAAKKAEEAEEAAKLAKNRASGGDQRSEKAKPSKTVEAGDCAAAVKPNGVKSGKGDDSGEKKKKHQYEIDFVHTAYVLGRADDWPSTPDRIVVIEAELYVLHNDAKEQDIAVFIDKLAVFIQAYSDCNADDDSELDNLECLRAALMECLRTIATLKVENNIRIPALDGKTYIRLEKLFFAALRCDFGRYKQKIELRTIIEAEPSKRDTAKIELPSEQYPVFIAERYGKWEADMDYILRHADLAAYPDRAVIFDGQLHVLHKQLGSMDLVCLLSVMVHLRLVIDLHWEQSRIDQFTGDVMSVLESIASPIEDRGAVQLQNAALTEKISKIRFGAVRCKYEPSKKEVEPNVESNEDDEYEEVGIFSDIKCKCVIS